MANDMRQLIQDARAIIRAGSFAPVGGQPFTIQAALAEIVEAVAQKLRAAHPSAPLDDIDAALPKAFAFEAETILAQGAVR